MSKGSDINALLSVIAGDDAGGMFEVRCRDPLGGRIAAREWFPAHESLACRAYVRRNAATCDVYVGAALRNGREGGRDAIERVWALWVDCDSDESARRLMGFDPQPTLVVLSGTGNNVHAYWSLEHPLAPAWAEQANRRLAYHLGADVKCADAARILRPPGTLNHKHDPPRPVEVAAYDPERRFDAASVVMRLRDPAPSKPPRADRPVDRSDDLEAVSSVAYYEALTGWAATTTTHVRCPFWDHRSNPSMMLYDGGTWNCFACGEGGSIYEFAALLWAFPLPLRGDAFKDVRDRLRGELLCPR